MSNGEKILKAYLITAGALLPAFTGITILTAKRKYYTWDKKQAMVFIGLTVVSSVALVLIARKVSK